MNKKPYGFRHMSKGHQLYIKRTENDISHKDLIRMIMKTIRKEFWKHEFRCAIYDDDESIYVVLTSMDHENTPEGIAECLESEKRFNLDTELTTTGRGNRPTIEIQRDSIKL